MSSPSLDQDFWVPQIVEELHVRELIAPLPIEAFVAAVFPWANRLYEQGLCTDLGDPLPDSDGRELGAVANGCSNRWRSHWQLGSNVVGHASPHHQASQDGTIRKQRIKDILTNPTYAGCVQAPGWDVSLRDGVHDGLISFAAFERIQERLTDTAHARAAMAELGQSVAAGQTTPSAAAQKMLDVLAQRHD